MALTGCRDDAGASGDDPEDGDDGVELDGDDDDDGGDDDDDDDDDVAEPDCDLQAVFSKPDNGCTNQGCHGVQHAAGLDLASPDLGERLVGKPSGSAACGDRLVIDPDSPDDSLLLTQITPEGIEDGCGALMPIGSVDGVSDDDYACIAQWVAHFADTVEPEPEVDFCDEFEAASPDVYVSKVKSVLTGRRATLDEIAMVEDDDTALVALTHEWVDSPEFEARLLPFLHDALQFSRDIGDLDDKLGGVPTLMPYVETNLAESYVRTMTRIIEEDRPLHEIATTTRWEVSTYTLAILTYLDAGEDERKVDHVQVVDPPQGVPDPIPLQYSIDNAIWQVPAQNAPCAMVTRRGANVLTMLAGRCQGSQNLADPVFDVGDFTDWRTVELVPAGVDEPEPVFWDVIALRAAQTQLAVGMPRVGFLTHPAFLSRWETNEDNQFRVTTNQALLVMTGHTFEVGDDTEPLGSDGLDPEHAQPDTACYQCHRALDPMRVFYDNVYDYDYVGLGQDHGTLTPAYAFRGEAALGEDLYDLADLLATNPDFATAWTQKLCWWANAQACDEEDPEFQRVAAVFEDSNFSFKTLVVELMTSPLVTGADLTETYCSREFLVGITRRDQLCHALDVRLGEDGLCEDGKLAKLVELVPEDAIARGDPAPVVSPHSSAFHAAGAEQFCVRLAEEMIASDGPIAPTDQATVLAVTVEDLMGVAPGTSRHQEVTDILAEHIVMAQDSVELPQALQSAFTLGCVSSNVMATGL